MANRKARYLYLIKRCVRPDYHKAPYHPVILCDNKKVALWEAGDSTKRAWVWSCENVPNIGWLLERWEGLDIDYGGLVKTVNLPDGHNAAFWHYLNNDDPVIINEFRPLFVGATWWSLNDIPYWLKERGVVYPTDKFSQDNIVRDYNQELATGDKYFTRSPFWI
jgi:hypothetical protein